MGIAAYNRGSQTLHACIAQKQRPMEFVLMDDLNAQEKYPDAGTPFGPVQIYCDKNTWFIACPTTGFGFWYSTLRELLRRWHVQVTAYDAITDRWTATPLRKG
jgi:hypothetical protein